MDPTQDDRETQPVYSTEELTHASIHLLGALEKSAALQSELTSRVIEIERYLTEGNASVASGTEPTIHVRIAHTHTIKDGWRLSETTVSYDGPVSTIAQMHQVMAVEMSAAYDLGQREAHSRNNPELYDEVAS